MACRSCRSKNQTELGAEINIHFPGREGLDKPAVLAYPVVVVCLDCGFFRYKVPASELLLLETGSSKNRCSTGEVACPEVGGPEIMSDTIPD